MKINLGCGFNKIPGYVNIDSALEVNPDLLMDLDNPCLPLPFLDNEVEEVLATHALEHIHNLIPLMNEIYRILKPGGIFKIRVPHSGSKEAFQDPTHVRFFNENSWQYFTKEVSQAFPGYGIKTDFVIKENAIEGAENIVELEKR